MASHSLQHRARVCLPKWTKTEGTCCYFTPFSSPFFNPKAAGASLWVPEPGVSPCCICKKPQVIIKKEEISV